MDGEIMADCLTRDIECCDGRDAWAIPFPHWSDFVQTIPKMYYDAYSQEQRLHTICKQLHKVICYADYLGKKVNITHDDVEKLLSDFEKFKQTGFLDYYEKQLEAWINANMSGIIEKAVKMVFFGLSLDPYGRFVAYIPDSWSDIRFDTVMDPDSEYYGRLILSMQVDDTFQFAQQPNIDY